MNKMHFVNMNQHKFMRRKKCWNTFSLSIVWLWLTMTLVMLHTFVSEKSSFDMKCLHVQQSFSQPTSFLHTKTRVFLCCYRKCSMNTKQMMPFTDVWHASYRTSLSFANTFFIQIVFSMSFVWWFLLIFFLQNKDKISVQ